MVVLTTSGAVWKPSYQILQLPACLFNDAVLPSQYDAHATEVLDFRGAHDERVNVEAAGCEDARHTRQDSRFVLNEAVECVACEWLQGRRWGCRE